MTDETIDRLYALELQRTLYFRRALDDLRNLAMVMLTAMVLVTFGLPQSGHLVLFFGSLAMFAVAVFEARTYRAAYGSQQRVLEIERNHTAPALDPGQHADAQFKQRVAASLSAAEPTIGFIEALAGRVSRTYIAVFLALDACWLSKIYLYPAPATSVAEFVHRVDLGPVPGWSVLLFLVPFWGSFIGLSVWFAKKHPHAESQA